MLCIVFLLLFPLLSKGEVSSFTNPNCQQFFLNGNHTTILTDLTNNNRYQQICQCLLDQNLRPQYFYATLYDTVNRIPVYSAYVFQHPCVVRRDRWYIEPQLDGGTIPCINQSTSVPLGQRGQHQALNRDYDGSGYDKGHLYPVSHTNSQLAMFATSTLTNAAPQDSSFNRNKWMRHEGNLTRILQNCNRAYVVTGVIPGNQQIGGRVRVAQFYWNAYCCLNPNGNRSNGFIGPDQNGRVENLQSVRALETRLRGHYNVPTFTVFPGRC
ncbi:endonuclease domain-containing 1 protein-like [Centroberyx affinis]|uniref:endonuclease domain-containing 1 protein-like n=1 Tax=Centroberyx affinis TaxID=166261 RepID=UPI003A5C71AF